MEKVNINHANAKDLCKIIHIGSSTAQKIIEKRPFKDIFELSAIKGIGDKRMRAIEKQGIAVA